MDTRTTYEGQSKFNFYLVALDFSILGLAVQTFSATGVPRIAQACEIIGWFSLLVSGLFALSYVEWSSKAIDLNTIVEKLSSKEPPSGDYAEELQKQRKALDDSLAAVGKQQCWLPKDRTKYSIGKWGFLAGVALLAVGRTWPHVSNLLSWPHVSNVLCL